MKCKKCKSGITSPIVKTTIVNGTPMSFSSCPVCGENLDRSNKNLITVIILIIVIGVASKYFL